MAACTAAARWTSVSVVSLRAALIGSSAANSCLAGTVLRAAAACLPVNTGSNTRRTSSSRMRPCVASVSILARLSSPRRCSSSVR
ncbi:Uncharacterised protein [Mycobacteroides abscessus subsp. abscessus]|nr:Uncharacterised protein [Mycobacteroides abscessus subsp. abscessus]